MRMVSFVHTNGTAYTMGWDDANVSRDWVESVFRERGYGNYVRGGPVVPTLMNLAILFAGSLRHCHPEIDLDVALKLLNWQILPDVLLGLDMLANPERHSAECWMPLNRQSLN